MGGHVRVGLEDNLYLRRGELTKGSALLVEKVADLVGDTSDREIATLTETRKFLGLKGPSETAI